MNNKTNKLLLANLQSQFKSNEYTHFMQFIVCMFDKVYHKKQVQQNIPLIKHMHSQRKDQMRCIGY